LKEVLKP